MGVQWLMYIYLRLRLQKATYCLILHNMGLTNPCLSFRPSELPAIIDNRIVVPYPPTLFNFSSKCCSSCKLQSELYKEFENDPPGPLPPRPLKSEVRGPVTYVVRYLQNTEARARLRALVSASVGWIAWGLTLVLDALFSCVQFSRQLEGYLFNSISQVSSSPGGL